MNDLVRELREPRSDDSAKLRTRAADEIERLRKALELIRDMGHDPPLSSEPIVFYRAGMFAMVHEANKALESND